MKKIKYYFLLFISCLVLMNSKVWSQKKAVDLELIENWKRITLYDLSPNGKYAWYFLSSANGKDVKLFVVNLEKRTSKAFKGFGMPQFSRDSRYLVFSSDRGVSYLDLSKDRKQVIAGGRGINLVRSAKQNSVSYLIRDSLFLRELESGRGRFIAKGSTVSLNPLGDRAAMQLDSSLYVYDLNTCRSHLVSGHVNPVEICWNKQGNRFAFLSSDKLYFAGIAGGNNVPLKSIDLNRLLARADSPSGLQFTSDGSGILIKLKAKVDTQASENSLRIWSYRDDYLQSDKRELDAERGLYVDFADGGVRMIGNHSLGIYELGGNHVMLKTLRNEMEAYFDPGKYNDYWLASLKTGEQEKFIPKAHKPANIKFSPKGNFVTWADTLGGSSYCYSIMEKRMVDLGKGISFKADIYADYPSKAAVEEWDQQERYLLVRDKYDLYRVDSRGNKKTVCITGHYGQARQIEFRLAQERLDSEEKKVLISVKEESTQRNGLVWSDLHSDTKPRIKFMDDCLYFHRDMGADAKSPVRGSSSDVYLLTRQTASEQPNLFLIDRDKKLRQITDLHGEVGYKWFSAELISYVDNTGASRYGILYRPDDLDSTKKYPLIFNYYMQRSYERFHFKQPDLTKSNINIPWYLSRGYGVCILDITPERGNTGISALANLEGMAVYLKNKYSWIDGDHMGIQGHSFGGYLTNFIATNSSMFAAAQGSNGLSDLISEFGGLGFAEYGLQNITEVGQINMGTSPSADPGRYVRNSPVFGARKTRTPLLLMHGKWDSPVKFTQSVELYMALRREGKPVWLLEYPDGHIIGEESAKDFQVRQLQFFDHYLKGLPAPVWMSSDYINNAKGTIQR